VAVLVWLSVANATLWLSNGRNHLVLVAVLRIRFFRDKTLSLSFSMRIFTSPFSLLQFRTDMTRPFAAVRVSLFILPADITCALTMSLS